MAMTMHNRRFVNREFSWLEFNQRVLDEALDPSIPLLERLLFLTISVSNLDEFYMVRAGGLQMLRERRMTQLDPSGLSPAEQLEGIRERVDAMVAEQYQAYEMIVEEELPKHGLTRVRPAELTPSQQDFMHRYFKDEIFPVATPGAIGEAFPLISGLRMFIAVRLKAAAPDEKSPRTALIPIGIQMNRFVTLPSTSGRHYILLEDIITTNIEAFFPGQTVLEAEAFRIARNADLSVNEEWATDLAKEMEQILQARRKSGCVRLEIGVGASAILKHYLQRKLGIGEQETIVCPGPLDLSEFNRLGGSESHHDLRYPSWTPQATPNVDLGKSMLDQIARRDILLLHPYESFDPVIRFLTEAAEDPNVLAIKQVLYRTSADSAIVSALRKAAANGKYVTVLVELKARFDEARNIEWARTLEEEGIQVIYGVRHLKTHAKICLVVRREAGRIVRYTHFGTGNYNEKTARLYCDVGLLTQDDELGADASAFFNAISGFSNPQPYRRIATAPHSLRNHLLECIQGEIERSKQGQKARIMAKMNSLVDPALIQALYRASSAGVDIQLCVRGICCLRPGVKGLSENIRVVSIIDRFLEHSRIFYFEEGGEQRMYIASADWMPRNLDRRIELMIPVVDSSARKKLIKHVQTTLSDTSKAREILANGKFARVFPSGKSRPLRSQEKECQRALRASDSAARARATVFEPHRPPSKRSK
ncbi:MAG: polyphosphate kinase [Kiritimatiellia bacterium]|jgi:polyphosphate kinase